MLVARLSAAAVGGADARQLRAPSTRSVRSPEHGLDSLMGVELLNVLSDAVERQLDPTLIFDHPSLQQLADHLLAELFPEDGVGEVADTDTAVADRLRLDDVEQLSDEELEARIDASLRSLMSDDR